MELLPQDADGGKNYQYFSLQEIEVIQAVETKSGCSNAEPTSLSFSSAPSECRRAFGLFCAMQPLLGIHTEQGLEEMWLWRTEHSRLTDSDAV